MQDEIITTKLGRPLKYEARLKCVTLSLLPRHQEFLRTRANASEFVRNLIDDAIARGE